MAPSPSKSGEDLEGGILVPFQPGEGLGDVAVPF